MIGRTAERDAALAMIDAIVAGGATANVLLVEAEAGMGKSTFLRAVRDAATVRVPGIEFVTVECSTPVAGSDIGVMEALKRGP